MSLLSSAIGAFGVKDYTYLAIILGVGGGALWFVHHERSIGEQKIEASDAKAVAVQVQRDTALKTTAALATSVANGDYSHAISQPITNAPLPDRLCDARGGGAVPAPSGQDGGGTAEAQLRAANAGLASGLQQFADSAVEIARDADAQVTALQADDDALRTEMAGATVTPAQSVPQSPSH